LSLSLETYFTAIMDLSVNSWRMWYFFFFPSSTSFASLFFQLQRVFGAARLYKCPTFLKLIFLFARNNTGDVRNRLG
jgi:hypothetical protein